MTVSSSSSRNEYNGNGVTTSFAYTFRILDEDHVAVYEDGVLQIITSDYTVTGVGNSGGGAILFGAAPAAGTGNVVIVRAVPLTQETDYVENDPFPAESHEDALDKLTMIVQQQQEILNRAFTIDVTDTSTDATLPTPEASKLLGWNGAADALVNYAQASITDSIVPTAFMETLLDDATAADARTTLGAQATLTDASQAEMEAGTEAAIRSMSPLRVAQAIAALGTPAGTIIDFGGSAAPTGYLACDGAAVSRTTYATLFAAVGTLWGVGNGTTTFNLPNFSAGWASVQTAGTVGASTAGAVIAHTHTANSNSTVGCAFTGSADRNPANGGTNTTSSTGGTHNLAGGNYVLKCIKT